jgi:hypothetical protein
MSECVIVPGCNPTVAEVGVGWKQVDGALVLLAPCDFVRRTLEIVGLADWIELTRPELR